MEVLFFRKEIFEEMGVKFEWISFHVPTVFSLVKSRKPCTLSWYAKYCKLGRSNLIRWRFALHLFRSTFWNTGSGHIPHFFAFLWEIKNPDFIWKSGFYCLLFFLKSGATRNRIIDSSSWISLIYFSASSRISRYCSTVRLLCSAYRYSGWFLDAEVVN